MQERSYNPTGKEEILIATAIRMQMQIDSQPVAPDVDVRYNVGFIDAICLAQAITDPWSQDAADQRLFKSNLHAGTSRARRNATLAYVRTVAADLLAHGETVHMVTPSDGDFAA